MTLADIARNATLWLADADKACWQRRSVFRRTPSPAGPLPLIALRAEGRRMPAAARTHRVAVLIDGPASRSLCGYLPNSYRGHRWPTATCLDLEDCQVCQRLIAEGLECGAIIIGDEWEAERLWLASCERGHAPDGRGGPPDLSRCGCPVPPYRRT